MILGHEYWVNGTNAWFNFRLIFSIKKTEMQYVILNVWQSGHHDTKQKSNFFSKKENEMTFFFCGKLVTKGILD